jgi:hypothetical protein
MEKVINFGCEKSVVKPNNLSTLEDDTINFNKCNIFTAC